MYARVWKWVGAVAVTMILATTAGAQTGEPGKYVGPCDVLASPDGATLYVVDIDANRISVVDPAQMKVVREISTPADLNAAALSPDGTKLYAACGGAKGTVSIIDAASGNVTDTIAVGHTPRGLSVAPSGKTLYVCNQFNNNVSVVDLETKQQTAVVPATREPMYSTVTPDGTAVYVTNLLPNDQADAYDVAAYVTIIDTATNQAVNVRLPNGSSGLYGVACSPDGKYVAAAHILARYQMPTTQLERGWMNTNAVTLIDTVTKQPINTVLLDDINLGAANPWGVAFSADGQYLLVTHAGTREISVIDAPVLLAKLAALPPNKEAAGAAVSQYDGSGSSSATAEDVMNDLAFLVGLRRRIKLDGYGPRGVAVVGTKAYAAEYFSDTLAQVEITPQPARQVTQIALGPAPNLTPERLGERNFHDADLCFQHWQSCASCHPDARIDALNWDLMNDGIGNPKNNRSMLLSHQTPPSMALGVRSTAELAVRAGITHIQFAVRPEEDAVAIDAYLKALQPVPSPHLVDGNLSEAAQRGKDLFEKVGFATCHPAPLYTDLQMYDVGSKGKYDREANSFDTPTLVEVWRTGPYMHDGHYTELKKIFTEGKHGAKGGDVQSLTDEQLNDLVEYVLSL